MTQVDKEVDRKQILKNILEQLLIMLLMRSLYVLVQTFLPHGVESIEPDKTPLLDFLRLLERNLKNMLEENMKELKGEFDGSYRFEHS